MAEYIPRSSVLQAVGDVHPLDYNAQGIVARIKAIPAADVVEGRHGRWIKQIDHYNCSACANSCWADSALEYDYCPTCGAKMEKGD